MFKAVRARSSFRVAGIAASLVASLALGIIGRTAPFAHADVVADARTQAAGLRTRLADLQRQTDRAVEQYDLLEGELGLQVQAHLSLERNVTDADTSASAAATTLARRARALYEAGGTTGLYASILTSNDLTEALGRIHLVGNVLASDRRAARVASTMTSIVAAKEQQAADAAAALTRRTAKVADVAERVRGLLAQQQAVVAAADAHVLELVRAQQAVADAVAAARFAALRSATPGSAASELAAPDVQPPSPLIAKVIAIAKQQLGKPYVWGAVGPDSFDCSGFTGFAYAAAGIAMPRVAAQQYLTGSHPAVSQLLPGDLLFWATNPTDPRTIDHTAMYLGNNLMIVAPHTGDVVKIASVYADGYLGATRVNPAISGGVPGPQWTQLPPA